MDRDLAQVGAATRPTMRAAVEVSPPFPQPGNCQVLATPPTCRNGCVMVPVGTTPCSRRSYKCGMCGGRSKCGHLGGDKTKRWKCFRCDYDVCFQCYPDSYQPAAEAQVRVQAAAGTLGVVPGSGGHLEDASEDALERSPPLVAIANVDLGQAPLRRITTAQLTRSTTAEVKTMLQGQLEELGEISALVGSGGGSDGGGPAVAHLRQPGAHVLPATPGGSSSAPGGLLARGWAAGVLPGGHADAVGGSVQGSSEDCAAAGRPPQKEARVGSADDDFLQRCRAAVGSPGARAPTLLESAPLRKATTPVSNDSLAPGLDYMRGLEAQLARRTTTEVKKVLQGHLYEFEDDSSLRRRQTQLQTWPEDAEPSPAVGADDRVVDIPELTRAPRREGCVTCTCMA